MNKNNNLKEVREGVILFAHGSRNAAWRKPFEKVLMDVAKRSECQAILAFGEFMTPNLVDAAKALAAKGVTKALIVPLFLGGGAHVRGDLPKLTAAAGAASGIKLRVAQAIGEDAGVLKAIADYSVAVTASRVSASRRKPS